MKLSNVMVNAMLLAALLAAGNANQKEAEMAELQTIDGRYGAIVEYAKEHPALQEESYTWIRDTYPNYYDDQETLEKAIYHAHSLKSKATHVTLEDIGNHLDLATDKVYRHDTLPDLYKNEYTEDRAVYNLNELRNELQYSIDNLEVR